MPGWDGFSIPDWFARRYDAPVLVDNDVNIMALGEHWTHWRDVDHLLFVKVGTGIGCGIVAGAPHPPRRAGRGGRHRPHPPRRRTTTSLCRCGNVGCLEAVAGGRRSRARLAAAGLRRDLSRDVVRLVRAGEPLAMQAVRDAGRSLGEVLAECINFFNPGAIVIGGDIAEAHQQLLAGVREVAVRALAADGHARPADGSRASSATAPASSAPRSWSSSTCSRPTPSTRSSRAPPHESPARRTTMARPVTLFTGQWADLPLEDLAARCGEWGFDGLELSCWGDHFDVAQALRDPGYGRGRRALLERHGLRCWAIGNHLVGQAVCDPHRRAPPGASCRPRCGATATPRACAQRAAERMKDTARAAAQLGVDVGDRLHRLADLAPPLLLPAQRLRRDRARL